MSYTYIQQILPDIKQIQMKTYIELLYDRLSNFFYNFKPDVRVEFFSLVNNVRKVIFGTLR